jgi:hypothetical protein
MRRPNKKQQIAMAKKVLFFVVLFYILYVVVKPIADLLFRGINAIRSMFGAGEIPQYKIDSAVLMVVSVVVVVALAVIFSPVVAVVSGVAFIFGASAWVKYRSRQKTLLDQEGDPIYEREI